MLCFWRYFCLTFLFLVWVCRAWILLLFAGRAGCLIVNFLCYCLWSFIPFTVWSAAPGCTGVTIAPPLIYCALIWKRLWYWRASVLEIRQSCVSISILFFISLLRLPTSVFKISSEDHLSQQKQLQTLSSFNFKHSSRREPTCLLRTCSPGFKPATFCCEIPSLPAALPCCPRKKHLSQNPKLDQQIWKPGGHHYTTRCTNFS